MTATEFKAKCLQVLDEVDGIGLVITKRGVPVARLVREDSAGRSDLIGCMGERIRVLGGLLSPWKK